MTTPKRRLITKVTVLALGILALLSWGFFRTDALGATVVATWSYDYGPQPACSTARTLNCIHHFEVQDITDQQNMTLIRMLDNPPNASGKVDHISITFKYGPPFGERTISVVAVGKDANGKRTASNPFAARVTVRIHPVSKMSLAF